MFVEVFRFGLSASRWQPAYFGAGRVTAGAGLGLAAIVVARHVRCKPRHEDTAYLAIPEGAGMSRLLLIGWDAGDWKMIDPLCAGGDAHVAGPNNVAFVSEFM